MTPARLSPGLYGMVISACLLLSNQAFSAETRALIISGLGGTQKYETQFQRHANTAANRLGDIANDITLLLGDTADRDAIHSALIALNERTAREDALVVLFIGHGSYDGEHFRFNVTGPDFSAKDLAVWLEPFTALRQLVVITGSSSGAALAPLAHPQRTVITATKNGEERNATVFARYFSEALTSNTADIDKDQRITAEEAFNYASNGVDDHYALQRAMATEHPTSEGPEAATILARLETVAAIDPRVSPAFDRRNVLEQDIAALKADKNSYTQADYYAELQRLLLELVVVEIQIEDAAESGQ